MNSKIGVTGTSAKKWPDNKVYNRAVKDLNDSHYEGGGQAFDEKRPSLPNIGG